jgi:ribosomal-protein-serine acetyltransferase
VTSIDVRAGLVLEPQRAEIADEYFALVQRNIARLALWEPWALLPQSLSGVRLYLAWQSQARTSGTAESYAIRLNGALVGSCSARIDKADGTAEIGYWVDAGVEGTGVAAESVSALVERITARPDIGRVQARTAAHNVRSRALLERLGFDLEGVLRSSQLLGDRRVDMAMYALLTHNAG